MAIIDRIMERLAAAFDFEPGYDAVYDRALDEALARGMERDEANGEATRVADEWQVATRKAKGDGR